jgi:hypothetical protein
LKLTRKLLLFLVVITISGVVAARSIETGYQPVGLEELKKQKGGFSTVLAHPEADLSRYTKIRPQTVALVISDPAAANQFSTGRLHTKRERENVIPLYNEVVEFKQIFGEALAGRIANDLDLELVDTAGAGTLILQPIVTNVEITTSSKNTTEDGHELPQLNEGTVVFDLMDGETGRILARFAEKRRNRPPKDKRETMGLWPNLPYWAEAVAADLCQELQRMGSGTG